MFAAATHVSTSTANVSTAPENGAAAQASPKRAALCKGLSPSASCRFTSLRAPKSGAEHHRAYKTREWCTSIAGGFEVVAKSKCHVLLLICSSCLEIQKFVAKSVWSSRAWFEHCMFRWIIVRFVNLCVKTPRRATVQVAKYTMKNDSSHGSRCSSTYSPKLPLI